MKLIIRIIAVAFVAFFVLRWALFSRGLDASIADQPVVAQAEFLEQREAFIGQQWKFQGVVTDSYYFLGVGYYTLTDSNGDAIRVCCNHYPPASDRLLEVVVYVNPVIKLDNPLTLQLEVEAPGVLFSLPNSSERLSYGK